MRPICGERRLHVAASEMQASMQRQLVAGAGLQWWWWRRWQWRWLGETSASRSQLGIIVGSPRSSFWVPPASEGSPPMYSGQWLSGQADLRGAVRLTAADV